MDVMDATCCYRLKYVFLLESECFICFIFFGTLNESM
jgi:hypothetical protein